MHTQLYHLSRRFPEKYVGKKGTRGDKYINHAIIKQRLLEVCGGYDFRIIREIYDGDTLTGCVGELRVVIDGTTNVIQEYGDLEQPQNNNGANAKHCASDAFKRCAMHIGLGLHVWIDEQYFLEKKLLAKNETDNIYKQEVVREKEADLETSTNGDGTSNSDIPTASTEIKDEVDGLSAPFVDSTNNVHIQVDEPTAQKEQNKPPPDEKKPETKLDKRLAEIKKEKVDNAKTHIDEQGRKVTYKYDK